MKFFQKHYLYTTLALLIIANWSMGIFFLPALPTIGHYLHASRSTIQLSYPLYILGAALSSLVLGPLTDTFGAKKLMVIQLLIFLASLGICFYARTIAIFLTGAFLIGCACYTMMLFKYLKTNIPSHAVKVYSILCTIAVISSPVLLAISGHIAHISQWQNIFALWFILVLICLGLTLLLPEQKAVIHLPFSFANYIKSFFFFMKNIHFHKSLLAIAALGGATSIFYTLAPHICIIDFSLNPKTFGYLMFIPTIGMLVGNALAFKLNDQFSKEKSILIGKVIATFGMASFVIIFYFFPNPIVFMALIAIFMVGTPLINNNINIQVQTINHTLAGSALAFLGVGLNAIKSISGMMVSRLDGELMGITMLAVLCVGFLLHSYLGRRSLASKST